MPSDASVGFTTGAQMANVTALAAARHHVLRSAGWDVEADGLQGAPRMHVIVGAEAHSSIFAIHSPANCARVMARRSSARRPATLRPVRSTPLPEIAPRRNEPVRVVFIRGADEERNGMDWVPEASRRARAIPVYAVLSALGRRGLEDLIERCCLLAERMAAKLRREPGIEILNDVVLNQVLVRCGDKTAAVIVRVQEEGVRWLGGTSREGRDAVARFRFELAHDRG